jgi:DNA-binding CsgD family transcriptional regulator
MTVTETLKRGREAYRKQSWTVAYTHLTAADQENSLEPADMEDLAETAYLIGKDSDCVEYWSRAHRSYQYQGNNRKAANCAFWLGMILFNRGETAQGSGWMARARSIIQDLNQSSVEQGLLLIPEALQHLSSGDTDQAYSLFCKAGETGQKFNNPDLMTLGRLGRGQALIHQNRFAEGTTLLDEAMVAVVAEEISPVVAGIVYCAVIDICQKIYDLRRAREWTEALTRWCDSQPDLVPYRGQCLVRRAEIMQMHGNWQDAITEVKRACEEFQNSSPVAVGEAFYRLAEIYRLKGAFDSAANAYRQASEWGRKTQPGLALLRLAQGKTKDASASIRRVEQETKGLISRSGILAAFVEIMIAADDVRSAQSAAEELSEIAIELDAPYLKAVAASARGSVLLTNKDPRSALDNLYQAWSILKKTGSVYDAAKVRVLIGLACRELGDHDTADMEIGTASQVFSKLGAIPDIERINFLRQKKVSGTLHDLTPRQLEVLRLVAKGMSNRLIAEQLYISERTVERHVSDMFGKLNVSSRSAATAFAYEHKLV